MVEEKHEGGRKSALPLPPGKIGLSMLQSWTKYFEQTSFLKKSLFYSLPLSNNVENVDKIHAGLAQLQHC